MQKKDLFIGVLLGLLTSFIGAFLFITFFTSMGFVEGYVNLKAQGSLSKLITLGALLNIGLVLLLFKKNKDQMTKGIILSLFLLTFFTLFV